MLCGMIGLLVLIIPFSIWTRNTQVSPQPVLPLHLTYSLPGKSPAEKIVQVREELVKKKYQAVVVTMLDEVAWLFNLRGSDIDFNPGV